MTERECGDMERWKLRGAGARLDRGIVGTGADDFGQPAAASHRQSLMSIGIAPHKYPDRVLAELGERLQGTVSELEELMFETPGVCAASHAQIHDAVALVTEALQALGKARERARRPPSLRAPMLNRPLARA